MPLRLAEDITTHHHSRIPEFCLGDAKCAGRRMRPRGGLSVRALSADEAPCAHFQVHITRPFAHLVPSVTSHDHNHCALSSIDTVDRGYLCDGTNTALNSKKKSRYPPSIYPSSHRSSVTLSYADGSGRFWRKRSQGRYYR
jgi:hypothetical protein